ncbi:MAG: RHS repeat-associated core domain-containing protein [Candidatus Sulfotelmatobacter sp.]
MMGEEIDQSGNVAARYAQTTNTDEPLAELRSGTTSYYERDAIGSVSSLSSTTGTLANSYTYDSFGKLSTSTGTLTNPFQYAAREFDPETGVYEYRARYYDQNVGRFISEDPLGFGGGKPNLYAYVGNNPTDFIDPFGLTNCVITVLGTVCSDWSPGLSWMDTKAPQKPPLPDQLAPSLSPKCDCAQIRQETRDRQLYEIGKELGITVAANVVEEGLTYYAMKRLAHLVPPAEAPVGPQLPNTNAVDKDAASPASGAYGVFCGTMCVAGH